MIAGDEPTTTLVKTFNSSSVFGIETKITAFTPLLLDMYT